MSESVPRLKTILKEGGSELLKSLGVRGDFRRIVDPIRTTSGVEIDFLAFVEEPGERPFLAHIELQTSKDPGMTDGMLARYAAIWRWTSERPEFEDAYIVPTVVYVGAARWKPKTVIEDYNLYFKHAFVATRGLDPAPLLASGNLGDVALSVLCRGGARSGLKKALDRIAAAPVAERGAALATLARLADLRGVGDRVRADARFTTSDLSE